MAPDSKPGWTNPETQRKLLLSMLAIATEPTTTFSTEKIAKAMANMGEIYTPKAISHQLPKIKADLTKIRNEEPVPELGTPVAAAPAPGTPGTPTPASARTKKRKVVEVATAEGGDDGKGEVEMKKMKVKTEVTVKGKRNVGKGGKKAASASQVVKAPVKKRGKSEAEDEGSDGGSAESDTERRAAGDAEDNEED